MLPPDNEFIVKISREEDNSEQTMRTRQDKARKEDYAAPSINTILDEWSTQGKF